MPIYLRYRMKSIFKLFNIHRLSVDTIMFKVYLFGKCLLEGSLLYSTPIIWTKTNDIGRLSCLGPDIFISSFFPVRFELINLTLLSAWFFASFLLICHCVKRVLLDIAKDISLHLHVWHTLFLLHTICIHFTNHSIDCRFPTLKLTLNHHRGY